MCSVKIDALLSPVIELLSRDFPPFKFLEEVLLLFGIDEVWENLSIISKIVHQVLESMAISIQEYFIINFLQLMKSVEHSS